MVGEVSTLAGSGSPGHIDGIGKTAAFNNPWGLFFDEKDQSVIVCDLSNSKIRKVAMNGMNGLHAHFLICYLFARF